MTSSQLASLRQETPETLYGFIADDLDYAISVLPVAYTSAYPGRITSYTARAIKAKIGPRICLHGTSSVSNDQIGKLFEDGICKVNIWTALERDASPALTEWVVKNAAKVGGPKMEQKLIDEGYLTASSKTGNKASLQHFTTAARQEIIFEEMKKIARGYLDLWYV